MASKDMASKETASTSIDTYLRENRRLEYGLLRQFAKQASLADFTQVVDHAVLVGSGVYSGMLEEDRQSDQTMMFNKRYIDQDDDAEISLNSAIFYLHAKGAHGNVITIGRAEANDLMLNDTPISREHAQIRVADDQYFLTDLGGTNGTMLNEQQMPAQKEVELQPGDNIGFGRYQFNFMTPERFYKWVHKY